MNDPLPFVLFSRGGRRLAAFHSLSDALTYFFQADSTSDPCTLQYRGDTLFNLPVDAPDFARKHDPAAHARYKAAWPEVLDRYTRALGFATTDSKVLFRKPRALR